MPTLEVTLKEEKFSVLGEGLHTWIQSIKSKISGRIFKNIQGDTDTLDHYLECAEVEEIPGALLCCAFYQADMNEAFTRMGLYLGAGIGTQPHTLVSQQDPSLKNYKKLVAGHNLPGETVLNFFQDVKKNPDSQLSWNTQEKAFYEKIVQSPWVQKRGELFYVIGLSIQNMKTYQAVVSHEIYHAHYTLTPGYKEAIGEFWNTKVTNEDQKKIIEAIGKAYNTENEDLVIDEFQAYLLQTKAERDHMREFVERYREALLIELKAKKIPFVVLEE